MPERTSTLSPENRAWADRQRERGHDRAPQPNGSEGRERSSRTPRRSRPSPGIRMPRHILPHFARPTSGKHALAMEMAAIAALTAVDDISSGKVPVPSEFAGVFALWLILAGVSELNDSAAHWASGLGGLVLLTVLLRRVGVIQRIGAWFGSSAPGAGGSAGRATASPPPAAPGDLYAFLSQEVAA